MMKTKTTQTGFAALIAMFMVGGAAFAQSADRLSEADANGDGAIEWQEMVDMRAAAFERLDRNDDGFADSDDAPRLGPAKSRFTEVLDQLSDADTDGDGRISETEMLEAPSAAFENGDTDGDQVLSAEEIAVLREAASEG